jgi:hypothetical protein
MLFSLNCLILGQDPHNIFNIPVGENSKINDVDIEFKDLTVANFKDGLFGRKELQGITAMNIWKVELKLQDIKNFSTEDDIKKHVKSEKMDDDPMLEFKKYYNNEDKKPENRCLHIFIVTSTGKCLPTFYLSNKKLAVTKYRCFTSRIRNLIVLFTSHFSLLFFFLEPSKSSKRTTQSLLPCNP